jgi:hypothetical protein
MRIRIRRRIIGRNYTKGGRRKIRGREGVKENVV